MTEKNPYGAPAALVADTEPEAGSPAKGVVYGVLVDILGTITVGAAIGFGYGIVLATSGASQEEIQAAVTQSNDPTTMLGFIGIVVGCGFSLLGGYVCARVAGRAELQWAALTGAISFVFGLVMAMQSYSLPVHLVLSGLAFLMVLLGGYLGARRNARIR